MSELDPHSINPTQAGRTSSLIVPDLDATTFSPSSVAQHYFTQRGHGTKEGTLLSSGDSHSDDVFDLARHYHTASPTRPRWGPTSTLGFFSQSDQFNVDQSVNFMDHSRGNYTFKERSTGEEKSFSHRRSLVEVFLSTGENISGRTSQGRSGSGGTATESINEKETARNWPILLAYFLIFLSFAVGVTFLALLVTRFKCARATTMDEEEMKQRITSIQASLVARGLALPKDLQDASSSQHHALNWLSRTDPARLEADDPWLSNRCALAVFFYSNHPGTAANHSKGQERRLLSEWKNIDKWMTRTNVCDWYGIECEDMGGNQKDIVAWNMTDNNLKGPIPSEIRAISSLVSLDLSMNQMTGTIPEMMYGFPVLRYLILRDNSFAGTISEDVGYLYPAMRIDFSSNELRGVLPNSINTAVNLQYLSLADNGLKGTIPDMTKLTSLDTLNLDQNKFVGTLPSSLTTLPSLSHISMEGNELSGTLPSTLAALSHLEILSLGHNRFNGGIPDIFEGLQNLTEVRLQKNLLQHKLPLSLGGLPKLKRVMLDSNRLMGPMPTEWMATTALEALILHGNALTGSIRSEIGYLVRLKDLWLNKNDMSGELPTHLGLLTALNTLYLQENSYVGTLPTEIGMLQDLQALRLSNTELIGVVPNEVCALKGKDELVFLSATCSHLRCMCCDRC